jgi:acid stress-induced BolA-like protein IbaG/YrbA
MARMLTGNASIASKNKVFQSNGRPGQCIRRAGRTNIPDPLFRTTPTIVNPDQVAELIRKGLPGADVRVQSDDNTHFAARVVSKEFAGKRSIARHQLIYKTLGELMGREIHAMSIEALTPEEATGR